MKSPSQHQDRNHKITDAERHKRFVETAKQVGASEEPKAFDKAFNTVVDRNARKNTS
jgi:hypothetical protein